MPNYRNLKIALGIEAAAVALCAVLLASGVAPGTEPSHPQAPDRKAVSAEDSRDLKQTAAGLWKKNPRKIRMPAGMQIREIRIPNRRIT